MYQLSRLSWIVVSLFILLSAFFYYPKWKQPHTEATISWDVSGYYFYLPAIFIYKDVKQLALADSLVQKYRFSPEMGQAFKHSSGNYVMKYSAGLAVQYLPFFAAAHFLAAPLGYPADGFSYPYQVAISWASLLVTLVGLWYLRKILKRYFEDGVVAAVLLLWVFGTNYLDYSAFNGAMTHNWLFALYTLLIYTTIRFYEEPSGKRAAIVGFLCGLATLTRPTELMSVLIPLFWGLTSVSALKDRVVFFFKNISYLLLACGFGAAVISIQLLYWKYVSGSFLVYSYQDQGFSWLRPHLIDGFFSARAGWLIYTPTMAFALAGFFFLRKRAPSAFWASLIFSVIFIYVAFAWDIWWYGGSLGQRAMVQAYPVLAFPMAAWVDWVFKRKYFSYVFIGLCALFVYYNLWLTHQAHKGGLLYAGDMTKHYFLRVLGRYETPLESLKLLDYKYDFLGERKDVKLLYGNDFESDTTILQAPKPINGQHSLLIDADHQYSKVFDVPLPLAEMDKYKWLRASAMFKIDKKEWDVWRMTLFVVKYMQDDQVVGWYNIRLQRLMPQNDTQKEIFFDTKLPNKPFNKCEVFFYNGEGKQPMYIDDLKVELFR